MSYLIDRRLNAKNKSAVNRQRFIRRYKKHIKKAVADAVSSRSITDIEKGEEITIPNDDIQEPVFSHSPGGKRTTIHPGNKEFVKGDKIPRPKGGGGAGGSKASNTGEGMDDFAFQITQDEFLEFMFDDLELPNLVKRQLAGSDTFKYKRAGYSTVGTPNQINIVRSLRAANARRIALGSPSKKKLAQLQQQLEQLLEEHPQQSDKIRQLEEQIEQLSAKVKRIPFLDTFDIKYNLTVKEPQPTSKAVMFCIMDVSGSMNQATKDMAKRFFILLYLFLQRNYDRTDVVFIRHHTNAAEVDEEEFFYSRETGGTIVSSALSLMKNIMDTRYPTSEWNIYGAQASDGDNWDNDSSRCYDLLVNEIMPHTQHYSYVEISPREHQSLWHEYEQVKSQFEDTFATQQIIQPSDIYPVFRELFQRRPA
ncbi:MAG: YeaH/YhbH family protein [Oceanicoccus sp.]|uniref:YeaH/YhbH family protein n=1 Tax=Oceanicoccus sp. TaxID=2691044 RepID=UPI00260CD05E|nr:YeaH/YhbH family protein [Oceanicoccus sp.]MCP3907556.1 YeaH/YhbH family protein [Oceanicoccus sp.]MDG1772368.1 YeaH/YhbH family protein [Oceanicoccus sp.]